MGRMLSSRIRRSSCRFTGAALIWAFCGIPASAQEESPLRLVVETPAPGTVVGTESRLVFVSGRALRMDADASGESPEPFDVVIALDTSASTRAPSGADVDGDGTHGRMPLANVLPFIPRLFSLTSSDPGDSILAAEVEGAKTLLDQLDPATTRVGVVAFSEDDLSQDSDARVALGLTGDYEQVEEALNGILEEGPAGMTNISRAVEVAADALAPVGEEPGRKVDPSRKVVLLMTDGQPTLPVHNEPSENGRRALEAARRATERNVRFDTFGISRVATDDPEFIEEIAAITGGVYTPVRHPRDLVATFHGVHLAGITRLSIRNATTGRRAELEHLGADGTFSGIVELAEGLNTLEVEATSDDGISATETIRVRLGPAGSAQMLPGRLLERRRRLLESRQDELGERTRELLVREMEAARRRQEQLQKRLDIRPEATGPANSAD